MIEVLCLRCGKEIGIPDDRVGCHMKCPYCQLRFVVQEDHTVKLLPSSGRSNVGEPNRTKGKIGRIMLRCVIFCWVTVWNLFRRWFWSMPYVWKVCFVVFVFVLVVSFFNRATDTASQGDDLRAYEASVTHYNSNVPLSFDMTCPLSSGGVFGLRWGEQPKFNGYKLPCDVTYAINHGLFSAAKLSYDGKGLFSISLTGIQSGSDESTKQDFMILSAFAQSVMGTNYDSWTFSKGSFAGIWYKGPHEEMAWIRADTSACAKRERLFFIMDTKHK